MIEPTPTPEPGEEAAERSDRGVDCKNAIHLDATGEGPARLYGELAEWWPLFSPPEDYGEEAEIYRALLARPEDPPYPTLLEIGSGGGNNASHLKPHFRMTLVDPSPGMLAHSRALNPECEHHPGDMRTLRLGKLFDAVFIHDAICYMTTEAELRQAMETAFVHCRPNGLALFAPDFVRETFVETIEDGGADGDGRAIRYLAWSHDPGPEDTRYTVDYAYLLRESDGSVWVEHDRHLEGLFPRETWLRLMMEVGFNARRVAINHTDVPREMDVFLGKRPPS